MRTVKDIKELRDNIETLRKYINDKTDPTFDFAVNLVKKGTCFVVVKVGEGYEFYPSRFVGYYDNDMDKHLSNTEKDGKETNPVISEILGNKPEQNPLIDKQYRDYCELLGFTARDKGSFGVERKYWEVIEW